MKIQCMAGASCPSFPRKGRGRKEAMRIIIGNLLKRGMILIFPLFLLTACTDKNDIVLELEAQNTEQSEEPLPKDAGKSADELSDTQGVSDVPVISSAEVLPAEIYVHICGAVTEPGVYVLSAGSRIFEGIEAAGGFREDACEDFINLAQPLQDGARIVIPTLEEAEEARQEGLYPAYQDIYQEQQTQGEAEAADGRVNINTATEQELSGVNGIGAGKAAAIIQYRQENGSFACIEDIMKVSGIKEGTFEKIKDKITVN